MNSAQRSQVNTFVFSPFNIPARIRLIGFSLACTIICLSSLQAQQAVLSSGAIHHNDVASVQWALGEVVTESFVKNDVLLTHGIHQPVIIVTEISSTETNDLKVFPNPVQDHLLIVSQQNRAFTLFDGLSRTITTGETQITSSIDFTALPCGAYILSIATAHGPAKTFRIIKK